MTKDERLELVAVAQVVITALGAYKNALKQYMDTAGEHEPCTALKSSIILNELITVDQKVIEIIQSGTPVLSCGILGYHVAVVEHALVNIQHIVATAGNELTCAMLDLMDTTVEVLPAAGDVQ